MVVSSWASTPSISVRRAAKRPVAAETRVLAMKGHWPQQEIDAIPPGWRVVAGRRLAVPGLDAARSLIELRRS